MPSIMTDRMFDAMTSLAIKAPCRAVATSNITLFGLQTINGVTTAADDRVLVTAQSHAIENGIWLASTGNWTRAPDFDGDRDAVQGTQVPVVRHGTQTALYELTTPNPVVFGSSVITFLLRYSANTSYDITSAEIAVGMTSLDHAYPLGHSARYGMDRRGIEDASSGFQRLLDMSRISGNYSHPWNGQGGASPICRVLQGRYKLSRTSVLTTGTTLTGEAHPANTASHTRLIMNSTAARPPNGPGDNRNRPILRFNRKTFDGSVVMNAFGNFTIENLELWYVAGGASTFDSPLAGTGIAFGDYPDSGSLLFDIDVMDVRIRNCVFQHAPAALRFKDVPNRSSTRGDGVTGSTGVHLYVENCEYDASSSAHIYATNTHFIGMTHRHSSFYGARSYFRNRCTGSLYYEGCELWGGAAIDLNDASNRFDTFRFTGRCELAPAYPTLYVVNARNVEIDVTMDGASAATGILLYNCDGGRLRATIENSGRNAPAGTGDSDFVAAIKLMGCRWIRVDAVITATTGGAGAYRGFGVLSVDSSDRPAGFNVFNVTVSAPYDGSAYRGQTRYVNVAPGDIVEAAKVSHEVEQHFTQRGLRAQGFVIEDNAGSFSAAHEVDLDSTLTADGVYLITAHSYPISNVATFNQGMYVFMKRAAGGGLLTELGASNPVATGQVSARGTTVHFSYDGANAYKTGVFYHLISRASVG